MVGSDGDVLLATLENVLEHLGAVVDERRRPLERQLVLLLRGRGGTRRRGRLGHARDRVKGARVRVGAATLRTQRGEHAQHVALVGPQVLERDLVGVARVHAVEDARRVAGQLERVVEIRLEQAHQLAGVRQARLAQTCFTAIKKSTELNHYFQVF